jgi:hypothetical protein
MPDWFGNDGDETIFGDPLPEPTAEAEALLSAVTAMIGELDEVILTRDAQKTSRLGEWAGPARTTWDEEFTYSQLDLQAVIDDLQAFKGRVEAVMERIRDHNRSVVPPTPTGTTTTTTTTPMTTTRPGGGSGGGSG